jgi:hypothetical protein
MDRKSHRLIRQSSKLLGSKPAVQAIRHSARAKCGHTERRKPSFARDIDPSADRKERRPANAHPFEVVARQWFKLLEARVAKGQLAAVSPRYRLSFSRFNLSRPALASACTQDETQDITS